MTPRPRNPGRRNWPENLYGQKKGRVTYYSYRHPQTGKRHGMGTDYAKAAQAARLLNAQLMSAAGVEDLVREVVAGGVTLYKYLEDYKTDTLPAYKDKRGNPYAPRTLEDYQRRIGLIQKQDFTARLVHDVTRLHIAEFLKAQSGDRTANIYRQLLRQVFRHAVADGLRDDNPAEETIERRVVVQRQRLSHASFLAIRRKAEPWFQNALDLALQTLQRREDLSLMRFDQLQGGNLLVRQTKVENHGTGNVRIRVGPQLQAVIDRCRDELLSPFMIHRKPARRVKGHMTRREHWTQVLPEQLTREFQRLRDQLKLYDNLSMNERPSFHEIRALGADLYRDKGAQETDIQKLLGHATEQMTRVYLDRHGEKWVDAAAGLDV